MPDTSPKKSRGICFVIMGFGEKTDFRTQRVLDLDKTYRIIIKPAVEKAGLECIRADDVVHAGVIDKHMYELLYTADVVVADLSTSNENAIYELGVRHALKPNTTIVIAESKFNFPFDVKSLLIRPYEHLGKGIDAEEAKKARKALRKAIKKLMDKDEVDSPVYTFLPELIPPSVSERAAPGAEAEDEEKPEGATDEKTSVLMEAFQDARADSDFVTAKVYLNKLHKILPADPYIIQQLALATYKSKLPNLETALLDAHKLLQGLDPEVTNDTETLGLWGAVHKRLWELKKDRDFLEEAIRAHAKGFYLKNDTYNGINYAFLLNARAKKSKRAEAIADFVFAERVRRQIIETCKALIKKGIKDDEGNPDQEEIFWVRATLVEAYIGVGELKKAKTLKKDAIEDAPEYWMPATMNSQIKKLKKLLKKSPLKDLVS